MVALRGGDKLETVLRGMARKLARGTLRVGYLEGATYPNGTSVAMVAAIQEYGAPRVGIPPRPSFRNMIAAKSPGWPSALGRLLVDNDYNAGAALDQMGAGIKDQLQESIVQTNSPPLSPVTLMLRKMKSQDQSLVVNLGVVAEARRRVAAGESVAGVSRKPLIETGTMRSRVDWEITR